MISAVISAHFEQVLQPVLSNISKPENIFRIATKLPQILNHMAVEKILNKAFVEQITDGDFDFLQGRKLQIELIDGGLFVGISFNQGKISCCHFALHAIQSDVTLSIDSLNAILLIEQQIDPDTLFFQRKLKINGDTELAHHVKNTIDTLNPDLIPPLMMKVILEYKKRVLVRAPINGQA